VDIDRDLLNRLPPQVRDEAARHVTVGDYGSLVGLLDEHLAGGQQPDPAALLCVALARIRWATEVMVDELVPSAELALVHVAAARRAGAPARDADAAERFIRTMLDGERQRQAEETDRVFKILDRAHAAWKAQRFVDAVALFRDASRQRRAEGRPGEFNDEIRAALCLAQAGRFEEARPVLEQALVFDWAAAGIWNDRHMTEHAAMTMLRHAAAAGDGDGATERHGAAATAGDGAAATAGTSEFARVWDRAQACAERLAISFPSIHPFQEELLDLTVRLRLPAHCRQVVDRIRARDSRLDAAALAKVQAAEAYLATGG
jgi:tetratricopeptide (TPR) repeat protein